MKKYIISGGSGLIGKILYKLLRKAGNRVSVLSRDFETKSFVKTFHWNIKKSEIDLSWLSETDTIIHLAGAGVSDKKWTTSYKKEIYDSRINSTKLLFEALKNNPHTIKTIVAASAIGIYGNHINGIADEDTYASNTFLAELCRDWEKEVLKFETLGIRTVILRTGIVLSKTGGFISKVSSPIKKFVGSGLGNGKQMMSWIHIDDLCKMYIKVATDEKMYGVYNAVAPMPVDNNEITRNIAKHLHRPIMLPNVPKFVLKLIFGEMAEMLLADQIVSCKKILNSGFTFQYPDIDSALDDLMR